MIDISKLGKRIAEARHDSRLTQKDLADRVGVTAQAVSKWERGESCPDICILDEIADTLCVSVPSLLGLE